MSLGRALYNKPPVPSLQLAYAFSGFSWSALSSMISPPAASRGCWPASKLIIRKQEERHVAYSHSPLHWAGRWCQSGAGRPSEIVVITRLLAAGFYSLLRLLILWRRIGALGGCMAGQLAAG